MVLKTAILTPLVMLAWCTTPGGSFCTVSKQITPTPADVEVISAPLTGQLVVHNETGAKLCGWKP